ncbi:endonuclease domain-containing protein [Salinarimonas chemoclinalis]|uniref:endonuclease domain-containing protein n=1 Tax=Salinarimonas chemoclinalis TaxID=3241599 RepID=UPI003555CA15
MPTRYRDDPEAAPSLRARDRARAMRKQATEAEKRLWWHLRHRIPLKGSSFRRQVPLGRSFVDFCCLKARLVVEVDGATHGTDEEIAYDAARTRFLEGQDFQVVRFTNTDVMTAIDDVLAAIHARLTERCPELLP